MFANISLAADLLESEQMSRDIFRLIIQSQSNLATLGIMVVVAVAAIVAGASWFSNFYLVRRELKSTIEFIKSETATDVAKRIKDEVEKMERMVGKSLENRMTMFDAEKARLFAFANEQIGALETSVIWWAAAIEGYSKVGEERLLRVSVEALNSYLDKCKRLSEDSKKKIKNCFSFIPEILRREKNLIEYKLNNIPTEITKKSRTT